jgi:PAS domain S-box-containing protein
MASLFLLALTVLAAATCRRASTDLPTLRSIAEIQQTSLAQASQGFPVEVEGFIPFHIGKEVFLCDSQACVALDTTEAALALLQDPRVRVRAKTSVVDHRRLLTAVDVQVLGQMDGAQEDEPTGELSEVLDGKRDAVFVTTRGRIRGPHIVTPDMFFTLAVNGSQVPTFVHKGGCGYPALADAEVRLVGVAVARHDAQGQLEGARLLLSRCSFVRIINEGPADLFAGETQSTAAARSQPDHLVLVRGTLRASGDHPPRYSVQDAQGSLAVRAVEGPAAAAGDPVLVAGYPEREGEATVLADALVQKLPLPARPPAPVLPTLTTVAQVRGLSPEEAQRGYPVRLNAVVTYTESRRSQFFVQDATAGIYVSAWRHLFEIPAGQQVEIVGRSEPGLFAPIVDLPHVRVLGPGPFPVPIKASFDDLLTGSRDSQWVEVEGLVRGVRRVGHAIQIEVIGIGLANRVPVTIPNFDGPLPTHLIDSRVRIRGVCAFNFNQQRQPVSAKILAPNLQAISVVEASAADPFSVEAIPLDKVMGFDINRSVQHRVRIRGTVSLHVPGRLVYVQDGKNGMMVSTEQEITLHPGDIVDAVGFPSVGPGGPVLDDSLVRVSGKTTPPVPYVSTPEQIYDGVGDALLMTMRGRVVNSVSTAGEQILTIRDRSFLISAHLRRAGSIPASWPPVDALVDVTGVCSVQTLENAQPQSYRLLLRGDDDVRLVEGPPWWTRGRVMAALILVTSILLFSWLWVGALQRTVRQQTAVIQTKLAREAALEERYRKLFESANDIVFTLDLNGGITSLNRAGCSLFGLSAEEAKGRNIIEMVLPGHETRARMLINREQTDDAAVYELDAADAGGVARTLEVSSRSVSEDGRILGFEGIARDVTERKQTEQQLLQFAMKLEQSNTELQSFADVASHDLQEPLRKVRAFTEKLEKKWESLSRPEIADLHQRMQSAVGRMQALISQLLAYARLGNVAPQMVPVDLSAIAREVMDDLEARVEDTGGRIECGPLPTVMGDATQLRQLLQNLAGNALKFGRPGAAPLVRVYATEEGADGHIEIAVQDNGIGFEQKEADRVFQAFYRLHTRQQYEGTGLGLAICHRIVERHGGTIRATSVPGVGTTFSFTLTLANAIATRTISAMSA